MTSRAAAPVVGVALLLLVGVGLGGVVAVSAEAVVSATGGPPATATSAAGASETVGLSLTLDDDTVSLTHEAGPALELAAVELVVTVDGVPLRYQPPVPFFAASGFRAGPTGPFNVASDDSWSISETGSFRLAATNAPRLAPGRTVSVTVLVGNERVGRVRGVVD
ncbi:MAG: type IV pilin [Halobellus sp.]|uniref:type IV pilin n=1 Tax=Halobellus sp. TaxID=1979212 RepID=UPI0035D44F02